MPTVKTANSIKHIFAHNKFLAINLNIYVHLVRKKCLSKNIRVHRRKTCFGTELGYAAINY